MNARHTFPASAPLYMAIWANGEAAHYDNLKDLAEASEGYMVSPVQMIVLLEDGTWRDCEDDVREELDAIESDYREEKDHRRYEAMGRV